MGKESLGEPIVVILLHPVAVLIYPDWGGTLEDLEDLDDSP